MQRIQRENKITHGLLLQVKAYFCGFRGEAVRTTTRTKGLSTAPTVSLSLSLSLSLLSLSKSQRLP